MSAAKSEVRYNGTSQKWRKTRWVTTLARERSRLSLIKNKEQPGAGLSKNLLKRPKTDI